MQDFNSRVIKRRKELGLTQAQLARKAGIPQSTIGQIENGRNKSTTKLLEIAAALEVSPEYLMYGKNTAAQNKVPEQDADIVTFEYWDISVSCGSGANNADYPELIRRIDIPKKYANSIFGTENVNNIEIVGITGDSMEPTIPKKSLAFVDKSVNEFTGDGVYAFTLCGHVYMKRLQRLPGKIAAISDNSNYERFYIDENNEDTFRILAKFTAVLPLELIDL